MKNLLTNRKQSDIINKLLREKRQTVKSDLEGLKSGSKINFENLLTNLKRCDIIEKLVKPSKRNFRDHIGTKENQENFKKLLKNLLTNSKRCDIITKSSERSERQS